MGRVSPMDDGHVIYLNGFCKIKYFTAPKLKLVALLDFRHIATMRPRIIILSIGLFFGMIYAVEGWLFRDYNLDEFQVATAYLKDRDPSLFASDFIWSKPEMVRNLHVPVRSLMRVTEGLTLGTIIEPIDLFLWWIPICVTLFFIGIYLLCMEFTGSRGASILTACSFMLVRRTIWDWWGLGPTYTMSARGLVLSLLPLAFWAFFRYREKLPQLAGLFFLWGLVSNLHPLSGWGFVEFLGISILLAEKFRLKAWLQVAILSSCTLLGNIPFLLIWTKVVQIPQALQANPAIIKHFWDGFMGLEAPPSKFIFQFLQDLALPFLLSLIGFASWSVTEDSKEKNRESSAILYLFPLVVAFTTIFVMIAGRIMRQNGFSLPVMIPEHSRNIKFIYLSLSVWMAFAFRGWIQSKSHSSKSIQWGIPILFVLFLMIINLPGHKLARHFLCKANLMSEKKIQKHAQSLKDNTADLEVALWAQKTTPKDSLFYFDSYEFRYYARRSLVFCWFDRPCVGFRPTQELEEWIARRNRLKPFKDQGATEEMFQAAQDYHADYLVILNTWKPLQNHSPIWSNWKYSVYNLHHLKGVSGNYDRSRERQLWHMARRERRASPTVAVRSEQQSQMPQWPIAQWVAHLFAIGGVVLPHETAAGIAAVARLADSQKSATTRPIIVSGCALN